MFWSTFHHLARRTRDQIQSPRGLCTHTHTNTLSRPGGVGSRSQLVELGAATCVGPSLCRTIFKIQIRNVYLCVCQQQADCLSTACKLCLPTAGGLFLSTAGRDCFFFLALLPSETQIPVVLGRLWVSVDSNVPAMFLRHAAGDIVGPTRLLMRGRKSMRSYAGVSDSSSISGGTCYEKLL